MVIYFQLLGVLMIRLRLTLEPDLDNTSEGKQESCLLILA